MLARSFPNVFDLITLSGKEICEQAANDIVIWMVYIINRPDSSTISGLRKDLTNNELSIKQTISMFAVVSSEKITLNMSEEREMFF